MEKLDLDKAESQLLDDTLQYWQKAGLLDPETAQKLQSTYQVKGFDWKRLAKYSFWVALLCGFIAFSTLIIDDKIIVWLQRIYDTPDALICAFSTIAAVFCYYKGVRRRSTMPEKEFSNEALFFVGVLFTACCIAYLGKSLNAAPMHYSFFFLLSVIIYGYLGWRLKSSLIWLFALLSLSTWFGMVTSFLPEWSVYFLEMNFALRFTLFGAITLTLYYFLQYKNPIKVFAELTHFIGLLYLFISLWLLSIFGNFAHLADWFKVKQVELFYWAIISTVTAFAFMLYGLKKKDDLAREFGITFLLINIYTRYFEYFWDSLNKSIFFIILGLSFWLIGRKAEKIWNLKGKSEE